MKVVPNKSISADMTSLGYINQVQEQVEQEMSCGYSMQEVRSNEFLEKGVQIIPRWMVGVNSSFRVKWDMFIVFLAFYNCISIPLIIAFDPDLNQDIWMQIINILTDFIFMFDIFLNFRTTYINQKNGQEIIDQKKILIHYSTSKHFYLDLMAAVPFELIQLMLDLQAITLFKLLKLIRIIRFGKLIFYMRSYASTKLYISLMRLMFYVLVYVHILACVFYILVSQEKTWIPPTDSILEQSDFYEQSTNLRYWYSYYYSVFFLVGAEVIPTNKNQTIFAAVAVLVGAILTAIIFGEMALIVTNFKAHATKMMEREDQINTAMKNMKLPQWLQNKISEYFLANQSVVQKEIQYKDFLELLTPSLELELNAFIFSGIFQNSTIILADQRMEYFCQNNFEREFFQPEKLIFQQYDQPDYFYFISEGFCSVFLVDQNDFIIDIRTLGPNEHFGQVAFIYKTVRTATVQAKTYTTLAKINKSNFNYILNNFDQVKQEIIQKVKEYNNPFHHFQIQMLKRLSFLKNLDTHQINSLLYSLPSKNLRYDQYLFKQGEKSRQVYFIVQGKLALQKSFRDRRAIDVLGEFYSYSHYHQAVEINSRIVNQMVITLQRVQSGSVLCGRTGFTHTLHKVSCRALQATKVLVLKTHQMEELAKTDLKLSVNLSKFKKSLFIYDVQQKVFIPKEYPLDIFNCNAYCRRSWKLFCLFKNTVIKFIERRRGLAGKRIDSVQKLVIILQAIIYAEERGRFEIARMIANRQVEVNAIKSIGILKEKELSNPLLAQFAAYSREFQSLEEILNSWLIVSNSISNRFEKKVNDFQYGLDQFEEVLEEWLF